MNGKKDIELYDILKRSDYLFPDMATAVGLNNNGRYDLIRNQTLSDVINEIKNYKMQKNSIQKQMMRKKHVNSHQTI